MALSLKPPNIKQQAQLFGCSLLIAHFFIALGRDDAFWGLFLIPGYYQDLIFVSLIVFVVSQLILVIWKKLDQWHPWQLNFRIRSIYQVLAGVMLPTFLSFLLVYGYMAFVLSQDITRTSYFYYELPVSIVIILMINLMLALQQALGRKEPIPVPPPDPKPLMVQSGHAQVLLDPEQILLAEKEDAVCLIYAQSKNRYIFPHSLDLLSQQLQPASFFRTNRQTISHRNNCHAYETERSGKLILTLHYPPGKTITISQKKAKEFKAWLKGHR